MMKQYNLCVANYKKMTIEQIYYQNVIFKTSYY